MFFSIVWKSSAPPCKRKRAPPSPQTHSRCQVSRSKPKAGFSTPSWNPGSSLLLPGLAQPEKVSEDKIHTWNCNKQQAHGLPSEMLSLLPGWNLLQVGSHHQGFCSSVMGWAHWPFVPGAEAAQNSTKVGKQNFSLHFFICLVFRCSEAPGGQCRALLWLPVPLGQGKWAPNKRFSVGAMHISAFLDHGPSLHPLWDQECARMSRFLSAQHFSTEQRQSWEHCTSKRGELMNEKTLTFTQFRHVTFI